MAVDLRPRFDGLTNLWEKTKAGWTVKAVYDLSTETCEKTTCGCTDVCKDRLTTLMYTGKEKQ